MQNACVPFECKKITILGLGLLGRGVGDTEFLASCGARVIVTDKKDEGELAESVELLKHYSNITFRLGGHSEADFIHADLVIKAAGVRLDSPEIAAAHTAGVPVYMSTALFAKYAMEEGAIIVGVTGTRGKSTTTSMIYHTLSQAGKRVHIGGNIRGKSTLAMLPDVHRGDIVVLELDSWQLQGFGDLQISPLVAVFTNLMPDHQNYYPSMDAYFDDKANIFKYQKNHPGVALMVGGSILDRVKAARPPIAPRVPPAIPDDWNLKIIGGHNRENASFAAAALRTLGLSEEEIRSGVESFEAIEGRLQLVREFRGIKIYNDNTATTPEATIAALRAVGDPAARRVVLIVGGDDKQLDMSALVDEIPKWCSKVVMFKERGTNRIRDSVWALESKGVQVYEEEGLEATFKRAVVVAEAGEMILYSPAFSSFGKYFKNEYDRSDQFVTAVKALV